ncbi:MAG: hypothetical protein ACUZ8H_08975 [Candidatus Anammoxibacter sp.]
MKITSLIITVFLFVAGCSTLETVTFRNDDTKYINKIAILGPEQSKGISVNVTGDTKIMYLLMGPAIIPQIMLAFATHQANKDEAIYLDDLIFDFNIEEILREKFKNELEANTYFHPVLQDEMPDNAKAQKILSKFPKDRIDYITIAQDMDADTIIELSVYSYGIKDPGILWDPNVILTVDVKMVRVVDNKTLWQTRMTENTKRKTTGLYYSVYRENNAELLRFELEAAAAIVAKALVHELGFEIKEGIKDIREVVIEKAAKMMEEYNALYQSTLPSTFQGNTVGARARISPRNLNSMMNRRW